MTYPTVTTSVEFTAGVWTDISEYVIQVDIQRGRSKEVEQFDPGTATYTLDNSDGRFNPLNTSSPYYPNVKPNKRIRTIATRSAVNYPRFQGFINTWPTTWIKELSEIQVSATDGFKQLQQAALQNPYVSEVLADSPKAYYRLNESGGTVAVDSSGNGHNGSYVGDPTFSQSDPITDGQDGAVLFDGLDDYVDLGTGPALSGDFTVIVWLKHPTSASLFQIFSQGWGPGRPPYEIFMNAGTVISAFANSSGGFDSSVISVARFDDDTWQHLAITRSGTTMAIYRNGVLDVSGTVTGAVLPVAQVLLGLETNGPPPNHWNSLLDELALYDSALPAARILAHYNARTAWSGDLSGARIGKVLDQADWPTADRDLDTGNTTLQSAGDIEGTTALEHIQKVAESEYGAFYISKDGKATFRERHAIVKSPYNTSQATFGDSGVELPYSDPIFDYDELEIRNDISVSRRDGSPQKAVDQTSIDTYLRRSYSRTGLLMDSDSEALSQAQWIREHFKDPQLRVSQIHLTPESETTLWDSYLPRELEDRVTVKARPPGGLTINEDVHIQGIKETIGPTPRWTATLYLSKADTQVYWLAGTAGFSEAGTTTRSGY